MRSSVADKLLADSAKKDEEERLIVVEKKIASVTVKKKKMEEAVEWAIAECGRELVRVILKARAKFGA